MKFNHFILKSVFWGGVAALRWRPASLVRLMALWRKRVENWSWVMRAMSSRVMVRR